MGGVAGHGNGEKQYLLVGSWQGRRTADSRFDDIASTLEPMSRCFSPRGSNLTAIETCCRQHRFAAQSAGNHLAAA